MSARERTRMVMSGSVARAFTSVGLVLLVTGGTIGLAFFGARSWLTLLPVGAGAAALAAALALGVRTLDRARARLLAEVGVVASVVFIVNVWAVGSAALIDVTSSARNTLSEASVAVARALTAPVVVQAALFAEDRAYADLRLLVGRYRAHSDRISLVRTDPRGGAGALSSRTEAGVMLTSVVGSEPRRQRVRFVAGSPDQEQQLTNALRAMSSSKRPRAYVLAGHGEPSVADVGPAGLRRFGQALANEGLEVVPAPLASLSAVPEDAALVVVATPSSGPWAPIAPVEVARLQRYLDGGGRLLVLLEPRGDGADGEELAGLLGSVAIQAGADVVIDRSAFSGLLGGVESATGMTYALHPSTSKLGTSMTHFPRARSLAENPIPDVIVTTLIQTGAQAYGETTPGAPSLDDADVLGPMTLAMAAERRDGFAARPSLPGARVVVVGDSTFATNQAIGLGANVDFAVHATLWLADREEHIAVRPSGRGGNLLLLSPTSRECIAFVLLYGLPVLLLGAGLTIRGVRRRAGLTIR